MSVTVYFYLQRLTNYNLNNSNVLWSELMHYCQLFTKEFYQHNISLIQINVVLIKII